MATTDIHQIHAAIAAIAAVCDGAIKDDHKGFASGDVNLGHYLASIDPDEWEPIHLTVAASILPRYHRQTGDIPLPPRPSNDEYRQARDELRTIARTIARITVGTSITLLDDHTIKVKFPYDPGLVEQIRRIRGCHYESSCRANLIPFCELPSVLDFADANGLPVPASVRALREEAANTPKPANTTGTCTLRDSQTIEVKFPYNQQMVDESRGIPGRRWSPSTKTNLFPITSATAVLAFANRHYLAVDEKVHAAAVAYADIEETRIHVTVNSSRTMVKIDAPYSVELSDALYTYNGGRYTWDKTSHTHMVSIRNNPVALVELFANYGLRASDATTEALSAEIMRQEANLAASVALTADPVNVPGLGVTLRPHQHAAVRHAITNRRTINGDLMGLGKTIESLAAVAATDSYPVVVACKPDLILNWAHEVATVLPGVPVHVATGTKPSPIPDGTQIIIIGFAALSAKPKGHHEFPWVTTLMGISPQALIVDESQFGKEKTANRSQALEQLGANIASRDGLIMALTGTAIVNRVRELIQQLRIIGRLEDFGDEWAFKFRYCGASNKGWGWDFDGATNLDELHTRLRAWGIYLRRGDDALNLPPLTIEPVTVPAASLDQRAMDTYRVAKVNLIGYLAEQARQIAERLGVDPRSAEVQQAMAAGMAEHLVRVNALRQIVAEAKLPAIVTAVGDLVEGGKKVMVAAHHREIVDTLAGQFGGLRIQGGQTVASKEADKKRFQDGSVTDAPTITVSITAGGTGHTLTAAADGIQAELCWTPGDLWQMAKRLHRIGQTRPVRYQVMVAEGTIDEQMWSMLNGKQSVLDAVLDGRHADLDEDERVAVAAVVWTMTEWGLDNE